MILTGDCVELMATLDAESVDAIVTDPPYDLTTVARSFQGNGGTLKPDGKPRSEERRASGGFMGKSWDGTGVAFDPATWAAAFRVAKPGAHLLAFGGTRTYHRLASAIEDAGWEIRDTLAWCYAAGFPKSSRVNRDPKFCQCASTDRSDEYIDPAPETDDRTHRAEPSESVGDGGRSDGNGTRAALGSQERYWHDHGLGDGPPRPDEVTAPVSAPSPSGVLGRSRSGAPVDDAEPGPSHSPSQVQRTAHPSSPGSTPPRTESAGAHIGNEGSTGRTPSIGSDSGLPESRTERKDGPLSAWPHCTTCGKPNANGYGSALKPAFEPIVMARKPLQGTLAGNVYKYGTGALNIDATRIPGNPATWETPRGGIWSTDSDAKAELTTREGRWPANLILTDPIFDGGVDGVVGGGEQTSTAVPGAWQPRGAFPIDNPEPTIYGDTGTYSRFFLIPKAARSDREPVTASRKARANLHPTVKPVELMRHLVRLVTPPGGTVLDCFLGSGTTAIACELEGFAWIGIEKEPEYVAIAEARLNGTQRGIPW